MASTYISTNLPVVCDTDRRACLRVAAYCLDHGLKEY